MPNAVLRLVADPLPDAMDEWRAEHAKALKDLCDTFADTQHCIGLAAVQLGDLWRLIVVDVTPERTEPYVMVNPTITRMSEDCQSVRDGCMSIFNGKRHAITHRPKRITVEWLDPRTLDPRKQKFTGLLAAAIHHEIDHLNGVLFIDHIDDATAVAEGLKQRRVLDASSPNLLERRL